MLDFVSKANSAPFSSQASRGVGEVSVRGERERAGLWLQQQCGFKMVKAVRFIAGSSSRDDVNRRWRGGQY